MKKFAHTLSWVVSLAAFSVLLATSGCSFRRITKSKDIVYREANPATGTGAQQLNVFAPRKIDAPTDVFVFVHGGSWHLGRKELYSFLGKRMARKGVTAVVIDYPLSPAAKYDEMAASVAQAVQWTYQHISEYGGNPNSIFVSGHSAGGHLAALNTVRNEYFDTLGLANPIRGAILIDAAGLDMYGYLKEHENDEDRKYLATFTKNPANWKEATPLFYLHQNMPPLLIYQGEKTYPSISKSTRKFVDALEKYVPKPNYRVLKRKKHIPMITQFLFPWNPLYQEIINFMQKTSSNPMASNKCGEHYYQLQNGSSVDQLDKAPE